MIPIPDRELKLELMPSFDLPLSLCFSEEFGQMSVSVTCDLEMNACVAPVPEVLLSQLELSFRTALRETDGELLTLDGMMVTIVSMAEDRPVSVDGINPSEGEPLATFVGDCITIAFNVIESPVCKMRLAQAGTYVGLELQRCNLNAHERP